MLQAMSQTMGDINLLSNGFLGRLRLFMPGLDQEENPLENTAENMAVFETELEKIAGNFQQVNGAMVQTRTVMGEYQQAVAETQAQLQAIQESGPSSINLMVWILTVLLVWFAITQIGFIVQGIEFIRGARDGDLSIENGDGRIRD
jgi:hypothetical protein